MPAIEPGPVPDPIAGGGAVMSRPASKIHHVLAIVALFAFAGCATTPPPTSDLAGARSLLERAREGLDTGAGIAEVKRAEMWLRDADVLMEGGRNSDALLLARRAAASAELALARQRAVAAAEAANAAQTENARIERELSRGGAR
jgi:hypothetical protein